MTTTMMMTERIKMKTIFTYKGKEYGYRVIRGKIYNIDISNEIDKELAHILNSAEFHDISKEDQKALFDEKMRLSHQY